MRVALLRVGAIVLIAGYGIAVAAQQRDAAPATGAASVAGTLVAGDTGLPIRTARVALTGERLADPLVTVTDDHGVFAFNGLAPGSYYLWAAKTGFVTASYGERRAGSSRPGTRLILADRQRLDKLRFALPRAAVISGIVVDEFGEPAHGVALQALRYVTVAGRRTVTSGALGESDDRGMYRISSLPPGEYAVVASFRNPLSSAFRAGVAARDSKASSPPAVLHQFRQDVRDASGPSYVDTYYPGTTTMSGATPITLGAGDERSGIDIRMRRVVLSRVSGVVRDADGTVPSAEVRLSSAVSGSGGDYDERVARAARIGQDGRFSFEAVSPGQYVLAARHHDPDTRVPSAGRWAQQDISVSGGNIDGITLTLQHGMMVTGVVVPDEGALESSPAGVVLTPASRFLAESVFLHAAVGDGGRFTMTNVVPGRFKLEFRSASPEWRLASAMFGGRDMADFQLDVNPGDQLTGVLTVTKKSTELSGVVSNANSQPVRDLTVIIFSAEERFWVPENRRNRPAATDADGRYSFANLPPGAYRLAAVDDYDDVAGIDANLLRTLLPTSVAITIGHGERKVQDLRVR